MPQPHAPTRLDKLSQRLNLIAAQIIQRRHPLPAFDISWDGGETFEPLPYHDYWGQWDAHFVMRASFEIPRDWPDDAPIGLHLPLGDDQSGFNAHPEALLLVDGQIIAATDTRHQLVLLPPHLREAKRYELTLRGWTGIGHSLEGDQRQLLYAQPCHVVQIHAATRDFVALARNVIEAAAALPADDVTRQDLLNAAHEAFLQVDTRHPLGDPFYATIPQAATTLQHALLQHALDTLRGPTNVTIHGVGHAHIDTAWLWTLGVARGKAARTFATALHLIDQFPEYVFGQSQPALYEAVREDHPEIFQRIKEAVAAGRWEPFGAMWVEPDCNVPSAESLARQFYFGRAFFDQHFGEGVASPILWLPDTFGFPATLPQFMAEAGIRYFFTTKIRWNEVNDFPHDTFWWEGLDGSRVLAHLTPTPQQGWLRTQTYNAEANARSLAESWQQMKHKAHARRALMAYGWGDGGGGPTPEMLENMAHLTSMPGIPAGQSSKALDFFEALQADYADNPAALPVWKGALYLETHQGTLTSQARMKADNRKAETLLHNVEYLATFAWLFDETFEYPHEALNRLWKIVLTHQFHDILPGSSIAQVYTEARETFAQLFDDLEDLHASIMDVLLSVAAPTEAPADDEATDEPATPTGDDPLLLENERLRARFNESGDLVSVVYKDAASAETEFIPAGAVSNRFEIYEDRPLRFDAWNIDEDHTERVWYAEPATTVERIEGVLGLRIVRTIMHSTVTQDVILQADRLDFQTRIDWQERHMILKVAFALPGTPTHYAIYPQGARQERPFQKNTSWEQAYRELPSQHGLEVFTERHRSIGITADSKYAYALDADAARITLLKAATFPDPQADRGEHTFTYSYGRNEFQFGRSTRRELLGIEESVPTAIKALIQPSDCLIETVKKAERDPLIVLRLTDGVQQATDAPGRAVQFRFPIRAAWRSNIMEEKLEALHVGEDNAILLDMRPHQIMTILVEPAQRGAGDQKS